MGFSYQYQFSTSLRKVEHRSLFKQTPTNKIMIQQKTSYEEIRFMNIPPKLVGVLFVRGN